MRNTVSCLHSGDNVRSVANKLSPTGLRLFLHSCFEPSDKAANQILSMEMASMSGSPRNLVSQCLQPGSHVILWSKSIAPGLNFDMQATTMNSMVKRWAQVRLRCVLYALKMSLKHKKGGMCPVANDLSSPLVFHTPWPAQTFGIYEWLTKKFG